MSRIILFLVYTFYGHVSDAIAPKEVIQLGQPRNIEEDKHIQFSSNSIASIGDNSDTDTVLNLDWDGTVQDSGINNRKLQELTHGNIQYTRPPVTSEDLQQDQSDATKSGSFESTAIPAVAQYTGLFSSFFGLPKLRMKVHAVRIVDPGTPGADELGIMDVILNRVSIDHPEVKPKCQKPWNWLLAGPCSYKQIGDLEALQSETRYSVTAVRAMIFGRVIFVSLLITAAVEAAIHLLCKATQSPTKVVLQAVKSAIAMELVAASAANDTAVFMGQLSGTSEGRVKSLTFNKIAHALCGMVRLVALNTLFLVEKSRMLSVWKCSVGSKSKNHKP